MKIYIYMYVCIEQIYLVSANVEAWVWFNRQIVRRLHRHLDEPCRSVTGLDTVFFVLSMRNQDAANPNGKLI